MQPMHRQQHMQPLQPQQRQPMQRSSGGSGSCNPAEMGQMFEMMSNMCKMMANNSGGTGGAAQDEMMGSMMGTMSSMMDQMSGGGGGSAPSGGGKGSNRSGPYAQTNHTDALAPVQPATVGDVQAFIEMHQLDQNAIDAFRALAPKYQTLVIYKGPMLDARNQTAVLIKRCQEVQNLRPGDWVCPGCMDIQWGQNPNCRKCGHKGPTADHLDKVQASNTMDVDEFLNLHDVQDHAATKLRSMDPKLQTLIISKGPMTDVNDQTAVLLGRCKEVSSMRPGDWVCPNCLDIQWGQNPACRKCGQGGPNAANFARVPAASPQEVEIFLNMHPNIQAHAIGKFKAMDPKIQTLIMSKGAMTDVKDQTAVLLGRCKEVSNMRAGDWVCPGCLDIQYARNASCRKCGAPKS